MTIPRRARPAEYYRAYRRRKRDQRAAGALFVLPPVRPVTAAAVAVDDPASAIETWSRNRLVVPYGHPRAGEPLQLPVYGVGFLRDVLRPEVREGLLCIARKNAKSAIVAAVLLAYLSPDGPMRARGFRAGVVSLNKIKAGELKIQAQAIAEASGIRSSEVRFLRSPAPGRVESAWGTVDILSSDSDAGAAAGFDLVIVDEIGLMEERDRELINGMRSSISARDGRFVSLSVFGSGPFIPEILERRDRVVVDTKTGVESRGDPALVVHLYQPPDDCALDDRAAWRAANPGLDEGIKAIRYMEDEARRVSVTVSDQASFRALDLNCPQTPSVTVLIQASDWKACETDEAVALTGACYVGIDLGGSVSMCSAVAFFPASGAMVGWAAFPEEPSLAIRGGEDHVGKLYLTAQARGELSLHGVRVVNVGEFLAVVFAKLAGASVQALGADRHRREELREVLAGIEVDVPFFGRGTGASATADGSHDVRSFQRAVLTGEIVTPVNLLFRSALRFAVVRNDPAGNPALDKATSRGRIDLVQAAVIACGLSALKAGGGDVPDIY